MDLTGEEAKFILEAPKRLAENGSWSATRNRGPGAACLVFAVRVQVQDALPRGVWFRASVIPQYLDSATFQLDCEQRGVRAHIPLCRVEWRPFRSHRNGPFGPEELRNAFIEAGATHIHNCLDHLDDDTGLIRAGGVQTARKIEPDFATYGEALQWTCDKLNILNRSDIPPPPAQAELF